MRSKSIALLGAGSWGTALALHLAKQGIAVRLWTNEPPHAAQMAAERCNTLFLPGLPFPDLISPFADMAEAVSSADYVLVAVPSVGFRPTLMLFSSLIRPETGVIWATKGLDPASGQLLHEVAIELLGHNRPLGVLSGPSFAREVAMGLPTAVVIATPQTAFGKQLAEDFDSPVFRTFGSQDLAGVGIGGVVKNVLAIATGITDGLKFGANARCALITRGLAEMTRLGMAIGGKPETFTGLAGIGDLVLTATDDQSRNRRLGLAIGSGLSADDAEKKIGQVVEGKHNARQLAELAARHGIHMPVTETVWGLLQGKLTARDAMTAFLRDGRP